MELNKIYIIHKNKNVKSHIQAQIKLTSYTMGNDLVKDENDDQLGDSHNTYYG